MTYQMVRFIQVYILRNVVMTANQRRERKSKKREKIRNQHLSKERKVASSTSITAFVNGLSRGSNVKPPARTDREGWDRYKALQFNLVVKTAFEMTGGDRVLRKFIDN